MRDKKTLREKFDHAMTFLKETGHGEEHVSIDVYSHGPVRVHLMGDMRDKRLVAALIARLGEPKIEFRSGTPWADWKLADIEVTTGGWPVKMVMVPSDESVSA